MTIEEERIERRLEYLQSFIQSAWTSDLAEVEALAERLRLELMLSRLDPVTKAFYRAAAHFLDEALDQLHEKQGADRISTRKAIVDYLKLFVEGMKT